MYIKAVAIHDRVLRAALVICRERGGWTFRPSEIVAALPELNAASVRTHVMSRCCSNAPAHHPHRWPYFRRLRRGVYEVRREWREGRAERREGPEGRAGRSGTGYEPALEPHGVVLARESSPGGPSPGWAGGVAEASGRSGAWADGGPRTPPAAGLVVEVREVGGEYRAEIAGKPKAIQSASLDETVIRIRDALSKGGSAPQARFDAILVSVQLEPERIDPVIAEYMKGFDRTLILQALKMSYEERLQALQDWANAMEEIRGAAYKASKQTKP